MERRHLRRHVVDLDVEVGDMLALLDRRLDRPLIDDPGADILAESGGIGDGDAARSDQADTVVASELHPGFADPLALVEKRTGLPGAEAPIHELDRFLDPLVEAAEA